MSDRVKAPLEKVIAALLPNLPYLAQWEAIVVAPVPASPGSPPTPPLPAVFTSPATVSVTFTDLRALALFGPLVNLPLYADASGAVSVPTPGSVVRVAFLNADPTKPFIAGLGPTTMPTLSVVQALRAFAGFPVLTPVNVAANAAILLTTLETLG